MRGMMGLAAIMLAATPAAAQVQTPPPWMYEERWMWWMMPFHGLLSLIFLAAIVVGVVLVIRQLWPSGPAGRGEGSRSAALDLLDARYARGEIEREEYLRRKQDLLEHRH